ncbi:MAG TPA: ABC transporter ATP-binding protein [Candidatus Limnocylindrales bacterium]
MLEIEGLHTYYGSIHALKGITLSVNEGEIVTLIGANGAGKTTTLNSISGIVRPRSGKVRLAGEDMTHAPPHEIVTRGVVQVPEGRRMFSRLTVDENLRMGAYTVVDANVIRAGIERSYAMFPRLKERRSQVAGTLSGGEQQMLAMARGLMSEPRILLLDEPSMGLAPVLVDSIFETIRQLHAAGTTILLVEQNARMALQVADRGYVIETGAIVMSDRADSLREDPNVQRSYLGIT